MSTPASLKPLLDLLAGYPDWLVVACLTVLAVVVLWIIAKLLKWSLYVLMALVLVGGTAATVWLLFDLVWPGAV